jgi:DNA gyrase subunit A
MISIPPDDKIRAYIAVKTLTDMEYLNSTNIIFCTKQGVIKKTSLEAYSRPRVNGINAININEGDQLLEARLTTGTSEILLAIKSGRAIRFNEEKVRQMGRSSTGVRGITLDNEVDEVVGMVCVDSPETTILVVSETGYGKRSELDEYRITNRGGKGVRTLNVTEKTGRLVGILDVTDEDDLMIINQKGVTIRLGVADLRVMGRATQGVRLIKMKDGDSIASITKVKRDEEVEGETEEPEATNDNN